MSWLLISNVALLAVVAGLGLVVLSLARQIGILHERTAPLGVLKASPALETGAEVPDLEMPTLAGGHLGLREPSATGHWMALLFVAADCPICKSVLPAYLDQLHDRRDLLDGFWVSDGTDMGAYSAYADAHGMDEERYLISQELGLHLQVRALPSLVLIDDHARLVVNQVVQSPRQLQALFRQAEVRQSEAGVQTQN
ncbi:MAG: alkyl hydroperoxide reductase [Gammaproteobacteria bacterium]|nr:alkyl hydroperoxide reductase [Gammaproteobacteria bacterium]